MLRFWECQLKDAATVSLRIQKMLAAVDGLRMAIILGIFFCLFRALGLSRAICGLVLLPLIWFYTGLTGWPAFEIRATVMLSVVIIGCASRRPSDLVNSLFAAAPIILI